MGEFYVLDDCAFHSEYYPDAHGQEICHMAVNGQWLVYHEYIHGESKWYKMRTDGSRRQEIMAGKGHIGYLLGFNRMGIWIMGEDGGNCCISVQDEEGRVIRRFLLPGGMLRQWGVPGLLLHSNTYIYGDTVMIYSREAVYRITWDNKIHTLFRACREKEYIAERTLSFNNEFLTFKLLSSEGSDGCPGEWVLYDRRTGAGIRLNQSRTAGENAEPEIYFVFLNRSRMWTAPTKQECRKYGYVKGRDMVEREIGRPEEKAALRVMRGMEDEGWHDDIRYFDGEDAYLDAGKPKRASLDGTSAELGCDSGYAFLPLVSDDAVFLKYDDNGPVRLPRRFSASCESAADNPEAEDVFQGTLEMIY